VLRGEEQGDAVKGVLATKKSQQAMADPSEIAKLEVYLASDDPRTSSERLMMTAGSQQFHRLGA